MFPQSFEKLIKHFSALPSIGPKMAERLVLFLFKQEKDKVEEFSQDLHSFVSNVRFCPRCFHVSERKDLCEICSDSNRDKSVICVVEDPLDVIALEKTRRFRGQYHVLGGSLSIMAEKEIEKLKISELVERAKNPEVQEVIIATNPTTDGDTTALYLGKKLSSLGKKVTRLGRGMPTGGDIEYADEITLGSAPDGRIKL